MTSPKTRVCPRCGEVATEARFCGECGLNLADQPELPTRDEWDADPVTTAFPQSAPKNAVPLVPADGVATQSSPFSFNSRWRWPALGATVVAIVLIIVLVTGTGGGGSSPTSSPDVPGTSDDCFSGSVDMFVDEGRTLSEAQDLANVNCGTDF